jgi:hypothetical protein
VASRYAPPIARRALEVSPTAVKIFLDFKNQRFLRESWCV